MSKVIIIGYDSERKRRLYWYADQLRYGYYEEHATVFDSEEHANISARYAGLKNFVAVAADEVGGDL